MKTILITSGPTIEHIDDVRFITNISTGKTGKVLCERLSKKNKIIYIHSKNVKYLPVVSKNIKFIEFDSFNSLNQTLKRVFDSFKIDVVIHLAAVSDYSPKYLIIENKKYTLPLKNKKITSNHNIISIVLKKNFKIIDRLKKYSKNKKIKIIGFKLTSNASNENIVNAVRKVKADIVIHNDTSQISKKSHIFRIFKNGNMIKKLSSEKELSFYLEKLMEDLWIL